MKKVLVAFWEIPDESYLFLIETDDLALFESMDKQYVNATGTPENITELINSTFYDTTTGRLKYEKLKTPYRDLSADLVITTGFFL